LRKQADEEGCMGADLGRKEWFTTDELIRWLGIGRTKTYELLRTGEIPSYKIGRVRRIRRQDVETWLERNKFPPDDTGLGAADERRKRDA
jgi:excisionase family DNA binding protein